MVLGNNSRLATHFGQALLSEGLQPPDPGAFSQKIAALMVKAL